MLRQTAVSPVRVILADLDDTLFDHARATQSALSALVQFEPALAGWSTDELDRRHRELLETFHVEVLSGRLSPDVARERRFGQLLAAAQASSSPARAREIARHYRWAYEQVWHPVAGALELLGAIKAAGLGVAVVTNNTVDEQRQKLDRCGLAPYVDALVTSEETGFMKPDAKIFDAALARVGASTECAVMIGDAWATDIEGARRAGVRAVWLNRLGVASPDASVPELRALEPTLDVMRVLIGDPE